MALIAGLADLTRGAPAGLTKGAPADLTGGALVGLTAGALVGLTEGTLADLTRGAPVGLTSERLFPSVTRRCSGDAPNGVLDGASRKDKGCRGGQNLDGASNVEVVSERG